MVRWSLPGRGISFVRVDDRVAIPLQIVKKHIDENYDDLSNADLFDQLDDILDNLYLQLNS